MTQSIVFATAYESLGQDSLKQVLTATKAKLMFVDPQQLDGLDKALTGVVDLEYVVYDNARDASPEAISGLKSACPRLTVMGFDELRELGKKNPVAAVPPINEDKCCIMYTSGSSGRPKGVSVKHKSIVGASKYSRSLLLHFTHTYSFWRKLHHSLCSRSR